MRGGALSLVFIVACGSRTTLDEPMDASAPDAAPPRTCTADSECNDQIPCTVDRCAQSRCEHMVDDKVCSDALFCTGAERCDLAKGCVSMAFPCDDGVACTNDSCDEAKRSCRHDPDSSKCPLSHACDPTAGCEERAFAHSDSTLYDIRLPSGKITPIGPTGVHLTDIALHPSNTLYGFSYANLYTVSQTTGATTFVRTLTDSVNAADVDPSGTMYVAGTSSLYTLDLPTGALAFVMSFPNNDISSGDIAFVGSRLFGTAHNAAYDELVEFDVANKTAKIVGDTGMGCIWALAAWAQSLYGMSCIGAVMTIDVTTGKAKGFASEMAAFWGATAR